MPSNGNNPPDPVAMTPYTPSWRFFVVCGAGGWIITTLSALISLLSVGSSQSGLFPPWFLLVGVSIAGLISGFCCAAGAALLSLVGSRILPLAPVSLWLVAGGIIVGELSYAVFTSGMSRELPAYVLAAAVPAVGVLLAARADRAIGRFPRPR